MFASAAGVLFDEFAFGMLLFLLSVGLSVTLVCCYKGYNASGGAKGVGQATTQAMVASALSIFILDFFVGVMLH